MWAYIWLAGLAPVLSGTSIRKEWATSFSSGVLVSKSQNRSVGSALLASGTIVSGIRLLKAVHRTARNGDPVDYR
jgi:hypothetical protein